MAAILSPATISTPIVIGRLVNWVANASMELRGLPVCPWQSSRNERIRKGIETMRIVKVAQNDALEGDTHPEAEEVQQAKPPQTGRRWYPVYPGLEPLFKQMYANNKGGSFIEVNWKNVEWKPINDFLVVHKIPRKTELGDIFILCEGWFHSTLHDINEYDKQNPNAHLLQKYVK